MAEKANDIPRLKRMDWRYIDPRMPWTQVAFIAEMLKQKYQPYERNMSAISNANSKRRLNKVGGVKGRCQQESGSGTAMEIVRILTFLQGKEENLISCQIQYHIGHTPRTLTQREFMYRMSQKKHGALGRLWDCI